MAGHQWTVAALVSVFALAPAVASGQTAAERKWEVEGHGGFAASTTPTGGDAATLPAGTPFATFTSTQSRYVSSWLFGDGTVLINGVNSRLAPFAKITPLDAVIGSAAAARGSGGAAGLRVTRRFGSRYSAEFSFDYARTPLAFTDEALDGIEASRSTFVNAFRGLFMSGPSSNPNVTAATTLTDGSRSELLATAVFGVDLVRSGKLIPFVVAGGGMVHSGGGPTARLVGRYAFPVPPVPGIDETDSVTIRVAQRANAPVGVFGGGVRYDLSSRWGVRGDVRFLAGGGTDGVLIDAAPSVVKSNPGLVLITPTSPIPTAVFSSANPIAGSLTGPAISGLRTFTASGVPIRTSLAAGVYLRF